MMPLYAALPWRRARTLMGLLLLGSALASVVSCTAPRKEAITTEFEPLVARFYLETKRGEAGVPISLPQSGLSITIAPRPVLVEYDIVNAEIAQVELGRCLLVMLTPAAGRDLYRLSVASVGRRLVLSLNDQFVGARVIDAAMAEGAVLIFLELPDAELAPVVERLKRTSAELAEIARKARKS